MADNERVWKQTYEGRKFYFNNPDPESISIIDIAHCLSLICRFTGGTRVFYSVAQHSVMISERVPEHLALWGLLHDAAEAYMGDMATPLKRMMTDFKALENHITQAIMEKFGLEWPEPTVVKMADRRMLVTEKRDLISPEPEPWIQILEHPVEPYPDEIIPWNAQTSEIIFLERFRELCP